MSFDKTVSVIGTGAVGGAFINLFEQTNSSLVSVWSSRSGELRTEGGKRRFIPGRSCPVTNDEAGELLILAVPDDQIPHVVNHLAESSIEWNGRRVVHCSGARFADSLEPLVAKGARAASMHPVQTFRRGDGRERFLDIFISLEGDPVLVSELLSLVDAAGAKPLKIDKIQKRALHLAAVIASNYLVTLQYIAEKFLAERGVEDGFKLVEPLVKQTTENVVKKGAAGALSGPVERGDLETITMHLNLLKENPDLLQIYARLGLETIELAESAGSAEPGPSPRAEITKLLRQALTEGGGKESAEG